MSARDTRRAFTLVELLVVIGIIAVLISILLPTLGKVRRQANTLQCSSNMRQVAMALIMYIHDNKGRFPSAGIPPIPAYPRGWWWPNELVRQGYVKTASINVYKKPNSNPATDKKFNRANPFRCPEGVDEDYSQAPGFPQGDYPTDALNNGFTLFNDNDAAIEGFGIPSWYQLNCRVGTTAGGTVQGGMDWPGGKSATPFVWFNTQGTQANPPILNDSRLRRTTGVVKRGSELIMVAEAANPNWHDPPVSNKYPGLYLKKLAARHGKKTADGANAFLNFAFFDGHVALYPSIIFNTPPANSTFPEDKFTRETIFWIGLQ
jgi:prepilin-type N-terminal cleavage/methylation domain-containing protein/prepilin-type processing-associated H-X9-DG protein